MAVQIYKNGQWRTLAGKKIAKNGKWYTPKVTDKIALGGKWYNIGFETVAPSASASPKLEDVAFFAADEPTTAGTAYYMTPEGAGNMDGTSWDNAYSGANIHVAMLSMASGDRLYMTEGNYTNERIIILPTGVSVFGGFSATNPTWATRDAFAHVTKWTQSAATFGLFTMATDSADGQCIDGITCAPAVATDYKAVTLRNMCITGGVMSCANIEHSRVSNATLTAKTCDTIAAYLTTATINTQADNSAFIGTSDNNVAVSLTKATNCSVSYCAVSYNGVSTNCTASDCDSAYFADNATNCTAVNCATVSSSYVFDTKATNCTAVNCLIGSNAYVFNTSATNCTAVNCKGSSAQYPSVVFSENSKNCIAINCTCYSDKSSYISIFGRYSENCIAINCTDKNDAFIFHDGSINCSAVNCKAKNIFYTNSRSFKQINCLSWNNSGTEFYNYSLTTTGAGSTYNSALALTLGTDNSIARFTNTGYYPAQGVQDTGDCPSPITDPAGYAAYVASFGDWHPLANSFLVGKGTAQTDVTTDADGVTRPASPTIGAYEPKPTSN